MSETASSNEAQAIIDVATLAAKPTIIEDGHSDQVHALIHLLPDGVVAQLTDLEEYAKNPRRVRGTVRPGTVDHLVNYLKRFGDERLTVWVHPTAGLIEAVLDDHLPGALSVTDDDEIGSVFIPELAGHGEHRAKLTLEPTPEWVLWTENSGRSFNQTDFAEHIETNGKEIIEPSAADMLEIAQSFHASSAATFRSAKRLTDGTTQFQYDEATTASAGKSGDMVVPAELKLAIKPFVGEPAYAVTARLRYRVSQGNLSLTYLLNRPDDVVRDALNGVAKRLFEEFDNVYVGTPR